MSPSATTGPATKVKSNASRASHASKAALENGYPHGHLGHLTPDEEAALKGFKAYLEEKKLYQHGPPPSHDDPTLLRFLRARKWSVPDAYGQFKDTEEWRKAIQLDVLYDTIDVEAYEQSRKLYPQWTGRRDRRGIPLYLFEIRHLDSKTISAYEKSVDKTYSKAAAPPASMHTPPKLIRLFALYENLTRFAQPLCTQLTDREHPRTPITLSTNIVDVGGVSLKQFWNLKGHMQAASQLATAHYPETLDRIFIIGAPAFFSTVWAWVKRWFDPVTVSKIFILSHSEVLPVLSSFIDPANIPRKYGGTLDFAWGDAPNLDPVIVKAADWEGPAKDSPAFPKGPAYWRPIDGGKRVECVAVGSVDKVERCVRVCTLPVAFPEGEGESAANGAAVPAVVASEAKEAPVAAEPTAAEPAAPETSALSPAAAATTTTGPASPGLEEGEDEFKTPLGSPLVSATQELSLQDPGAIEEKKMNGDAAVSEKVGETEAVPNGKPVVAA
ncbi:sec14 cytosolic factor [Diaporthe amygdali]|uniref:sec14 cytosolic factor n=1 Tax=Phomopsis amygdali TaxID=1214568 RepID=UPI0022FF2032|nr:sec14 cytosolic factor [Diaporthe amygdali]KAJ0115741.1 sec14 cytosolic factor [Diaporthe amygdali]